MRPKGICPVCKGKLRVAADPNKNYRYVSGYDAATNTLPCGNCGFGMFGTPRGEVDLRPDGTPCQHNFVHEAQLGRCYNSYKCTHNCGASFTIDSGD
jgi:hypothetical protein